MKLRGNTTTFFIFLIVIMALILASVWAGLYEAKRHHNATMQEIQRLQEQIEESRIWREGVQNWLDSLNIIPAVGISYYAPLDPAAIKGMCHDGDPTSTATGTYPRIGTMAVDPAVIPLAADWLSCTPAALWSLAEQRTLAVLSKGRG